MNDPDPAQATSLEDLSKCLCQLHIWADRPSLRELEDRTKHANGLLPGTRLKRVRLGRTTVNDMLRGRKLPKKAFLLTFVAECGINIENDRRWEQAWDRLAAQDQQVSPLPGEVQQLRQKVEELHQQLAATERRAKVAEAQTRRTLWTERPGPPRRSIIAYEPLLSPAALLDQLPLGDEATATVEQSRAEVRAVLDGFDDRLLVIAGPCSVHDPAAALDYAGRLKDARERHQADLLIVMRVYLEKPRTVTGWKGLINDPGMDGGHDVHRGLHTARRLLRDIVAAGLPVGCEWLDPITPQYIADTVTWGAIGARTTESQIHWQLVSGLSMPVGFKNGTDGDVQVAVDACRAAAAGHTFFSTTPTGTTGVVTTAGNLDTHVILRGGLSGPNYEASHITKALDLIAAIGLPRRLMVDASQDNSGKDHRRQPVVAASIAEQIAAGERGLTAVMLKSFLVEGKQEPGPPATLTYGQSVTDACMDFETTTAVLDHLAAAVRSRRNEADSQGSAPRWRRGAAVPLTGGTRPRPLQPSSQDVPDADVRGIGPDRLSEVMVRYLW